jgi:hypothetical protein
MSIGGSITSATAGSILFAGTGGVLAQNNANLFWDNSNTRLGISQSTPTSELHLNFNQNSVAQSDNNGILLANSTAATVGLQSISPGLVWQGNGWKTTATAGSQDVRFRADVLPVQGTTTPSATWRLSSNINNGGYTNYLTVSTLQGQGSTGTITAPGELIVNGKFSVPSPVQSAFCLPAATFYQYRTTDAGSNVSSIFVIGNGSTVSGAGNLSINIDTTNQLVFAAGNGTRSIARASISIASLTNTAGAESGDLAFLTQTGGTVMTEKMRIYGSGNVTIGTITDGSYKLYVNAGAAGLPALRVNGVTFTTGLLNVGGQLTAGIADGGTISYKTTNAGGTINVKFACLVTSNSTAGNTSISWDSTNQFVFSAGNGTSAIARAGLQITNLVNTAGSESGDIIFLTQSGGTAMSEKMRITSGGGITYNATNTASGTTGNQTINNPSGTVNIASAGTTVTVTNSLVTANSIVLAVVRTNDSTAVIKNVVPGAGSFVINLNAATTAETSIGFFVINQ